MRWRNTGAFLVVLGMATGCPSEFGKEGRVAKAVHQDTLGLVRQYCDQKTYDELCGGGKENTPECIRACG